MIETSRRRLLIGGIATLFAAPAIVRAASLMPTEFVVARPLLFAV